MPLIPGVRACVIFNPTAKGEKARRFRRHLAAIGGEATLLETRGPGDASKLARQAARDGFDTIVAAGGDGTLNEVLNGMAGEPGALARVRLGVLPLGTVNVFARELGLPREATAAWEVVKSGRELRVDLPRADWHDGSGPQARWFCQLAGAGLDALAIERVNWGWKKKVGPLAYVAAGLQALTEKAPQLRIRAGGNTEEGELVLLGNGRLYGGDYELFPSASLASGRLEVCVFPKARWWTLLRAGPELLLRERLPEEAVRRFSAARITVECDDQAPFELDGEWVGRLPVTFSLVPQALRVLAP